MINRKIFEELSNAELLEEIRYRSGCGTWMVGAECCTVHTDVIRLCCEILRDRGVDGNATEILNHAEA